MKKILFINPFGLGDILFTTPLVKAIKTRFPDTLICYWCNERVKDILQNNPGIDKIFALSRGDIKKIFQRSIAEGCLRTFELFINIRKEKFDVAFDFSLDHRYGLVSLLAGINRRVGFNYKERGRFLTEKLDIEGYSSRHIVDYYLELLRFLSIESCERRLELFVNEHERKQARTLLAQFGIGKDDFVVGIVPAAGASWGKQRQLKHWPAIKFAHLADQVHAELKAKIVLLGDENERIISEGIAGMMKVKPVDLTGKTDLKEMAAVMSNLDLLVTNDGGPMHMAVALGIKTVSIFGPVDEKVYGPYPPGPRHIVIKKDVPCRPCYQKFKMPLCQQERACIKSIDAGEVFSAVKSLWIKD